MNPTQPVTGTTPRTDEAAYQIAPWDAYSVRAIKHHDPEKDKVVAADFARTLELELTVSKEVSAGLVTALTAATQRADAAERLVGEMAGALQLYAQSVGIWWTMLEADRECSEQPLLEPHKVVLHFMGSGASTQVSVGDLRELNKAAQSALARHAATKNGGAGRLTPSTQPPAPESVVKAAEELKDRAIDAKANSWPYSGGLGLMVIRADELASLVRCSEDVALAVRQHLTPPAGENGNEL